MQHQTPFPVRGSATARLVPGVSALVDYELKLVVPAHVRTLPHLLRRIRRYQMHGGADLRLNRCTSLSHAVFTGLVASRLMSQGVCARVGGLYGALSTVGEIFGGVIIDSLPSAWEELRGYQREAHDEVLLSLGLPLPSVDVERSVELASVAVERLEIELVGGEESFLWGIWAERLQSLMEETAAQMSVEDLTALVNESVSVESMPSILTLTSMWRGLVYSDLTLFSSGDPLVLERAEEGSEVQADISFSMHDLRKLSRKGRAIVRCPVVGR